MAIYSNTLPKSTLSLIQHLKDHSFVKPFYLSGGTALSLHLGHRESEDLDFFIQNDFESNKLVSELSKIGQLTSTETAPGTVNTNLNGVKLQFLQYPYPLLEPVISWEGINLSSVIDIACTKIQTIGMRGNKKDFIDLFFLLKSFSLSQILEKVHQKYVGIDYSLTHLLKSLSYFSDADDQPMPRLHQEISWSEVKRILIQTVKSYPLPLL